VRCPSGIWNNACAAWEEVFHAGSLGSSRYFARIASTEDVVAGVERAAGTARGADYW
jgi:hypothetical protein